MQYRYETHMHTCQGSACGKTPGRAYIDRYLELGYTGIMITDHFFGGNTAVPKDLPWKTRVDLYCSGYEEAKAEGDRKGLSVFFGIEQNFDRDEYLIYGVDKNWLYAHPDIENWSRRQLHDQVRAAGGCMVQAHPFRVRGYIERIHLSAGCVDAIEGMNTWNEPDFDALAMRYARKLGLPVTAGSDTHRVETTDPAILCGVYFDHPLKDVREYADIILNARPIGLMHPAGRGEWRDGIQTSLPVELRDENDVGKPIDIAEFLDFSR